VVTAPPTAPATLEKGVGEGEYKHNFSCCGTGFSNAGAYAMHRKGAAHWDISTVVVKKKSRKARTLKFRAMATTFLRLSLIIVCVVCGEFSPQDMQAMSDTCQCGATDCKPRRKYQQDVAHELGIHPSMLSRWASKADDYFSELAKGRPHLEKMHPGPPPQYPQQEEELFTQFIIRRKFYGLAVDGYWLRAEFLRLLEKYHGATAAEDFRFSNGWVYRFCCRYDITSQCKTDKKSLSALDRIDAITRFHSHMRWLQNLSPGITQWEPEWGSYPPRYIWNADHVPLPFCVNLKRSLNPKGEPCWIAAVGASGLDKRQATIHPCIRADGEQVMDIFIIFRGKGCISEEERKALDALPNIKWCFERCAWANGKYSRKWLRYFCKVVQDKCPGEHLLLLDDLSAQKSPAFNQYAIDHKVLPVPIPPGCTDLLQPVDHGVGALLKSIMKIFYAAELEVNYDARRHYSSSKALHPSQRRILMATWLSHAWGLVRTKQDLLSSTFSSTVLVRRDGTHNLKIKGLHSYPSTVEEIH
jgi:hypothetical protein